MRTSLFGAHQFESPAFMHVMRAVSPKPALRSVECVFPSVLLYVPRDFVRRIAG